MQDMKDIINQQSHELFTTAQDMLIQDLDNFWPVDNSVAGAVDEIAQQIEKARDYAHKVFISSLDKELVEIAIRALATVVCLRNYGNERVA